MRSSGRRLDKAELRAWAGWRELKLSLIHTGRYERYWVIDQRGSETCSRRGNRAQRKEIGAATMAGGGGGGNDSADDREQDAGSSDREEMEGR